MTYSFANAPLKEAHAPLAMASGIHCAGPNIEADDDDNDDDDDEVGWFAMRSTASVSSLLTP